MRLVLNTFPFHLVYTIKMSTKSKHDQCKRFCADLYPVMYVEHFVELYRNDKRMGKTPSELREIAQRHMSRMYCVQNYCSSNQTGSSKPRLNEVKQRYPFMTSFKGGRNDFCKGSKHPLYTYCIHWNWYPRCRKVFYLYSVSTEGTLCIIECLRNALTFHVLQTHYSESTFLISQIHPSFWTSNSYPFVMPLDKSCTAVLAAGSQPNSDTAKFDVGNSFT